jgi:monoamine oxidase
MAQGSRYLRVVGGNDMIAKEMAARLDVRVGVAVISVRNTGQGVEVLTGSDVLSADLAVVAVPLPVLRAPGFLPDAHPELLDVLFSLGMGTAAKVVMATRTEPPMFRRQEPDIPAWYWTGARPDGATRHAITGFAGTYAGVAAMTASARERLTITTPEVELLGEPTVVDWGADPWAGGCYSAIGPGQRALLDRLQAPIGRIALAGEHVNGTGTMAGALASGLSAASNLLE